MAAVRRYGDYGGRYVAPPLVPTLEKLAAAFEAAWRSAAFQADFRSLLASFAGRPTPLYEARQLSRWNTGARLYFKREDQTRVGGGYINAALGQCLLAKKMGKTAVVGETGSGGNGVAAAAAAEHLKLSCTIYMAEADMAAEPLSVRAMEEYGARLVAVASDQASLHAAKSAATQHWMAALGDTAYLAGAPVGPYPYPHMVRSLQSVIGAETQRQVRDETVGTLGAVVATLGGGAGAVGLFSAFLDQAGVLLIAAEPSRAPCLSQGTPGILHGAKTLVLQGDDGQIVRLQGATPGISYPGAGPEVASWRDSGSIEVMPVCRDDALAARDVLSSEEGILISEEPAYALAAALQVGRSMGQADSLIVCITSSGDAVTEQDVAGEDAPD